MINPIYYTIRDAIFYYNLDILKQLNLKNYKPSKAELFGLRYFLITNFDYETYFYLIDCLDLKLFDRSSFNHKFFSPALEVLCNHECILLETINTVCNLEEYYQLYDVLQKRFYLCSDDCKNLISEYCSLSKLIYNYNFKGLMKKFVIKNSEYSYNNFLVNLMKDIFFKVATNEEIQEYHQICNSPYNQENSDTLNYLIENSYNRALESRNNAKQNPPSTCINLQRILNLRGFNPCAREI